MVGGDCWNHATRTSLDVSGTFGTCRNVPMGRNARLAGALATADLTLEQLGQMVDVDPKTVERWVTVGRVPHRRHREATSAALDVSVELLWPEPSQGPTPELVAVYPTRAEAPWHALLARARSEVDVLAYAAMHLVDDSGFSVRLRSIAEAGGKVRVAMGDVGAPAVAARAAEEGFSLAALTGRIELALYYLRPALAGVVGAELRVHGSTLYASMLRVDGELLVNPHMYGFPAASAPVLHLREHPAGVMLPSYRASFDRVWQDARPAG